jgi:dTDP-D-glucose 4,6-dehydratase
MADIALAQKPCYSTDIGFEEGLRRTVEWYQQSAIPVPQALAAHP